MAKLRHRFSARAHSASWIIFVGGLAVCGFATAPSWAAGRGQDSSHHSSGPPVPPRGKLGQELFIALDHRDTNELRSLLKKGANPNSLNGLEFTPLFIASASFQMEAMQVLIDAGAKPDAMTTYGSPLTFAAMSGNLPGATILLGKGAKVNTVRGDGMTVLMMAANSGNPALVAELLKRKADFSAKDDGGETALSFAARGGNVEVGKMLLAAGEASDTANVQGLTPLMVAAKCGHTDFVKLLLAHGAKPNSKDNFGRTALCLAAKYGDVPEVVSALIDGGANPKVKDVDGRPAAYVAASRGHSKCATLLGLPASSSVLRGSRDALRLSLKALQASMTQFTQSASCISCHHEGLGRIATGEARDHGFAVDSAVQQTQEGRLRGMLMALQPLHEQALKSPEALKQIPLMEMNEIAPTDTWLLAGMAAHHEPRSAATTAMAMVLAKAQTADGSWSFSLPRVPMQSSKFTYTALSVKALKDFGAPDRAAEIARRLDDAKGWLLKTQPKTSDDRASRLLGLKWSGAGPDDCRGAVAAVLASQSADGGWSQDPGLASDAYATGQALYALHVGGGMATSDPVYQKGLQFLLRTQDADGSWFVSKRAIPANNYFDAGFPHGESQFASFNGTCWATLALLQATDLRSTSR